MTPPSSPLEIVAVAPDRREAALWEAFGWEEAKARRQRIEGYLGAASANPTLFDHLLEARRGAHRVGIVWGHVLPGRMANLWPPLVSVGEPEEISDALLHTVEQRLCAAGACCGQALLPLRVAAQAGCLTKHGYFPAASFLFFGAEQSQFPASLPPSNLEFEPYRLDQRARLARLIEETYVETLDVPVMNGMRDIADVLEGYQHTGNFQPDRWFFVRYQGTDVGCLLLNEHAEAEQWELVYMGLTPAARGKRWGQAITRFAQWSARAAARRAIVLGVDAANYPAIRMYQRCGFFELEKRIAFLKKLSAGV